MPATMPAAVTRWRPFVAEASLRFGVPIAWIERVMLAESGGRTRLTGRRITSRAGAMGLMQLMPPTWAELQRTYGFGDDPHDPRDNILAGTAYLRRMYERFGYPGLFGAYNAGPARYAAYLAGRQGLPGETSAYLAAVAGPSPPRATGVKTPAAAARAAAAASAPRPSLFAIQRPPGHGIGTARAPRDPAPIAPRSALSEDRLFVVRNQP